MLRNAVNTGGGRRTSVLQRLFSVWFDAFVYNQIWEDPRVDLRALELDGDSRILTISSGGCNALNYLLEGPASVTAVDLNRHHIALLKLKIAAAASLPDHEAFFAFFGLGSHPENERRFSELIAGTLDPETKYYWENRQGLFRKKRISFFEGRGIYDRSRNGYFLRVFHRLAKLMGCDPASVLEAREFEEQLRLYEENIDPFFDSLLIRFIGRLPVTLFGLGIPPQQFDELMSDLQDGDTLIDVYRERTRRLATAYPVSDNYFAWQAFGRRYDTERREALPEYLKEENFGKLKQSVFLLAAKVGSVTDEIAAKPKGSFNRFVFLDAQDWMDPVTLTRLWELIAERGDIGSRIIFRTAGSRSPLESSLPDHVLKRFNYHAHLSQELFAQDRASIYGGFHLYTLR